MGEICNGYVETIATHVTEVSLKMDYEVRQTTNNTLQQVGTDSL